MFHKTTLQNDWRNDWDPGSLHCITVDPIIVCVFTCRNFAGGFWLAGALERALVTQLGSSGRVVWTGALSDSAGLGNVVILCIFLHLQPAGPRKARPACASPSPRIACVPSPAAGS